MIQRTCTKCGDPITEANAWTVKKHRANGSIYLLECGKCYPCHHSEALAWQRANRGLCKEYYRRSVLKHPETNSRKQKRYYAQAHLDKRAAWARAWHAAHRETENEARRLRYWKNRRHILARQLERRLDKKALLFLAAAGVPRKSTEANT